MKSLRRVRLPVTPWTAAYQAPPSVGFSRQDYCSGVPLPSPPVRIAIVKKSMNNKCWKECGEKGTLLHSWWEYINKLVRPLWRAVWKFLKKLKIELPYDSATPFLDIYLEKTQIQKYLCPSVHCSAMYDSQDGSNLNVHWQIKG